MKASPAVRAALKTFSDADLLTIYVQRAHGMMTLEEAEKDVTDWEFYMLCLMLLESAK